MSARARIIVFAVAAAALAAALGVGLAGLPHFGTTVSSYGRLLDRVGVTQRHATDVVSAVSFDYRGIDTLFEEFILFAAVAGIAILLRPLAGEARRLPDDQAPDRSIPAPSPTVGLIAVVFAPLLVLVGIETVTHGQVSPGGGFQGGVVLASALFLVYLATDYANIARFEPATLVEAAEGAGAGGYVAVGLAGLVVGAAYLTNTFGLGAAGSVLSAGTIPVLNLVVGVEVAGAFVLLVSEFLDQTAVIRGDDP